MIKANGVAINKTKIQLEKEVAKQDLLSDRIILVQKGKKNYFLILVS